MPQRPHNRSARIAPRLIAVLATLSVLLVVRPAPAEPSPGQLMKFPGFRNVVLTIAMVNKAMRDAADNPMDEWRRKNVQVAISMLPGAIRGLAGAYVGGQMSPQYFPMVQAMLGGFVDQSAPENYKKFLANPSRHNIPKVGSNFPVVSAPAVPAGSAPSGGGDKNQSTSVALEAKAPVSPDQLVDLSDRVKSVAEKAAPKGNDKVAFDDGVQKSASSDPTAASSSGPGSSAEGVTAAPGNAGGQIYAGGPASGGASGPGSPASSAGSAQNGEGAAPPAGIPGNEFLRGVSRELTAIEAQVGTSDLRNVLIVRRGNEAKGDGKDKEREAEELFGSVGKEKKGAAKDARRLTGRERVTGEASTNYSLTAKPKFWRVTPLLKYVDVVVLHREARAQGEGKSEDGGDKDGKAAQAIAQILFGVAAIIAAIAPMVIASIQAKADVTIAKINADTQVALTKITSDTSKELAEMQKDVALKQSAIAQQISNTNNAAVTDRLQRQLDELRNAREDARSAEKERRALEDSYNQQRIQLAKEQADQNLSLAKETLKAQLTQAGLTSGFGSSTNSGNSLTVAQSFSSGGTAGSSAIGGAGGGGLGLGASSSGLGARGAEGSPSTAGGSSSSIPSGSLSIGSAIGGRKVETGDGVPNLRRDAVIDASDDPKGLTSTAPGGPSNASQALLRSVSPTGPNSNSYGRGVASANVEAEDEIDPKDPKKRRKVLAARGTAGRRGAISAGGVTSLRGVGRGVTSVGGRLNQIMTRSFGAGSTRDNRMTADAVEDSGRSDLKRFMGQRLEDRPDQSSFKSFRETTGRGNAPPTVTAPTASVGEGRVRTFAGGYNAENLPEAQGGGHSADQPAPSQFPFPFAGGFPPGGGSQ